jgi:hydroxyacylglutathione hydrolase
VFVLTNGAINILVDTSVPRLWQKLQRHLDKAGIDKIDYLILTHSHFDHAGNARRIKERFNLKVFIQKEEAEYLVQGKNIVPAGTTIITRFLINTAGRKLLPLFRYESCQYDLIVDSIYELKEIGFNGYLMHTPGHTSGSMSLVVDDELALVGDTMFGIFRWSVFPPFAENVSQMINSWNKLLKTDCSIFIPSHGSVNRRFLVQKEYDKRVGGYHVQ